MDPSGSGQGQGAGSYERGNEPTAYCFTSGETTSFLRSQSVV